MPPSATGNASRQSRSASPSPRYAASSGFGRSRGRYGVVRGMPMQIASSGPSSVAERNSIAAQQRLRVRDRRRAGERGRRRRSRSGATGARASAAPPGSSPKTRRSGERAIRSSASGVVRVAVERAAQARVVERRATRRSTGTRARQRPLERDRRSASPAIAAVSSSEYAPAARSASGPGRAEQRGGPAVEHGLGRGHDDDDVGLDERRVDAQRHAARPPELDEVGVLDVVDLDPAVEAARELGRDERAPARAGPSRRARPPATRIVWSLDRRRRSARARRRSPRSPAAAGRARRAGSGSAGGSTTIVARPPRRASASSGSPGEREPQRVAHGGADVRDPGVGRGRAEHDRVVGRGDDDEPRAGEQRDAHH